MPLYEYRCERGHLFEVLQRMADDPVTNCTTCDAPVQRVFHPFALHFKGSGFYTTDYGRQKSGGDGAARKSDGDSSESKPAGKDESGGKSGGEKSSGEKSSGEKSSSGTAAKAAES